MMSYVGSGALCLVFLVWSFLNVVASTTHMCLPDQRDALLHFKHELHLSPYQSGTCLPKTKSWGSDNTTDCCSWEGVTCHPISGEVTGLDLSFSCLHGHFHSNSSLFRLRYLQTLNLAFNNFNSSPMPSQFKELVRLTHLNLSYSHFLGQVPTELLQLTKLVSLDLSSYGSYQIFFNKISFYSQLSTEKSFLRKLAQNLTHLRDLHLDYLNIASAIPHNLLNLSSLRSLSLGRCGLYGEFPSNILLMPSIRSVRLKENWDLRGHLPEFHANNNSLVTLDLSSTSFSGTLPNSIGNLQHLNAFSLSMGKFSGRIPSSIGNLSSLTSLDFSDNEFSGGIPTSISNLHQLAHLDVARNQLSSSSSSFPLGILNLTKLTDIDLSGNGFTGPFPPNMSLLSNLEFFYASGNSFVGAFPSSLLMIPSLIGIDLTGNQLSSFVDLGNISATSELLVLYIGDNNFNGPIPMRCISEFVNLIELDLSGWNIGRRNILELSVFSHLKSLQYLYLSDLNMATALDLSRFSSLQTLHGLDLSGNHISTTNITPSVSHFLPYLDYLVLSGCNLTEFPQFIRTQRHLRQLDLSDNMIKGQVPDWLWSLPSLLILNISHNSLTSFQGPSSQMFPESKIDTIDLSWNDFQGPLFIPSQHIRYLLGSNNNFTGGIPQSICAFTSLQILDLSHNNFSGSVPHCLENHNGSLGVLSLHRNRLSGTLPDIFVGFNKLTSLDLSHNRLEGKLPKSLIKCSALQVLNIESNRFKDTFPFRLGSLQKLRVLVLGSNEFYGPMYHPHTPFGFPKLRIIDISHNHFEGSMPSDYFSNWKAMSSIAAKEHSLDYMGNGYYSDSLVLKNKGLELEYVRILKILTAINLSGNRLQGKIPESIGLLKELRVLSFSSNAFIGHIPPSLANLTKLESVDMSMNKLSGKIPAQLGSLSSLAYINFSHNQLTGPIPKGPQFETQNCSCFEHNLGLFGAPLDQGCGDVKTPTSQTNDASEPDEEEGESVSWIAAAIGFAPGLMVGVSIGHILFSWKHQWFMKVLDRTKRRGTRTR